MRDGPEAGLTQIDAMLEHGDARLPAPPIRQEEKNSENLCFGYYDKDNLMA